MNGSWTQPRAADSKPFRGPVKNRQLHRVPMPASVMAQLLPRVAVLLGLPADAARTQVINAQQAERVRRGRLTRTPDLWWSTEFDPEVEQWLFVDTTTGLPTRSEFHNHVWHKVRRWVAAHEPENEWPEHIVYRNLRHHAATFWHEELGREWVDVAAWLGDTLPTVLAHYVRSGSGALKEAVGQLAAY